MTSKLIRLLIYMKITVVIPVFNLYLEFTKNCIKSILNQNVPDEYNVNILVINNCSTDNTSNEVKELISYNLPIQIIDNPENYGCAKSWNQGVEDAFKNGTDYVFIINNDVLFHKECIVNLVKRLEVNDEAILVSAAHVHTVEEISHELTPTVVESGSPSFSAFMIGHQCWELIGKFDEEFKPAYFEDNDYHYRIKLAGKKAISTNAAKYHHFGSKTQNQIAEGICRSQQFENNRSYFTKKWGGEPGKEIYLTPFSQ